MRIAEVTRPQTPEEIRERLVDPAFLPKFEELILAFSTLEDPGRTKWSEYARTSGSWEILTEEFIVALAKHLLSSAKRYKTTVTRPLKILEVGAGNGRLSHFLREYFDRKAPWLFDIDATDNGRGKIQPSFPIDPGDFKGVLTTYNPDVVISSWMPNSEDWTPWFRATESVLEYILIGRQAVCGTDESWGMVRQGGYLITPAQVDGFQKTLYCDMGGVQLCRSDDLRRILPHQGNLEYGEIFRDSRTASFQRVGPTVGSLSA